MCKLCDFLLENNHERDPTDYGKRKKSFVISDFRSFWQKAKCYDWQKCVIAYTIKCENHLVPCKEYWKMNHHFEYTLRTYDINIFELQFKTLITRRNKE